MSGYYLAKLLLTSGRQNDAVSYVPFIVRSRANYKAGILVQASVNTWQAYNNWGGKSLYTINSTRSVAATHVSFDRPYAGPVVPLRHEIDLLSFLEREGYDISYTTEVDIDLDPSELRRHRLVIVSGHSEYWSKRMRDAFEQARDSGTNLMFMGANMAYWQIRYEDAHNTIVEYRDATADPEEDPSLETVRFADLESPRPPCELVGVDFADQRGASDPPRAYRVNASELSHPWFARTGFKAGDTLPDAVGYEWDSIIPDCDVPKLTVFFSYRGKVGGKPTAAHSTAYVAESGARVFAAGSLQLVWGLNHRVYSNSKLQQFMRNVLAALASGR